MILASDPRREPQTAPADASLSRARIFAAVAELICEGQEPLNARRVIEHAGVSRATFDGLFADCGACVLAAFEDAVGRARARVRPAYERERLWARRIRSALHALLEFFDENPSLARLCLLDDDASGVRERREQLVCYCERVLHEGHRLSARQLPALTAECTVGGVLSAIHRRVRQGKPLVPLVNPLMAFAVYPYLGGAKASRELRRSAPLSALPRLVQERPKPPVRLTHRTLPIIMALADTPGLSNREVASAVGIADQGQTSKLLARLAGAGLVHNSGPGPSAGRANAWELTGAGIELLRALRKGPLAGAGMRGP
jgi:AcrR family transcriptional regulator